MTEDRYLDDAEPIHTLSPTAQILEELQLYGHRPGKDEPDPRPLPEADRVQSALAEMFDALASMLSGTQLEPDLEGLLWPAVNLFHARIARIERALDANEQNQKRSQREQDGSEIRSVELETLIAEGLALIGRREAFEAMRDRAAELFTAHTGQIWRPRSGSMISRKALTAAMIDSRDFLMARRRAETEQLLPKGAKIAFAGGADYQDHRTIWAVLDRVHAKHADMVLIHGGTPRGAEAIAACWARARAIPQILFKPDWVRYANAAPFKRNDRLIETLPIGLVIFPGSGVTDNLADKAKKLGIPLLDYRQRLKAQGAA